MSSWAYKDILRTNSITAEEAKMANKDTNYFCPNADCSAIMHISHCYGVSKARFRSLTSHPHIENCPYQRKGYQKDLFDEKKFDFDSAIENLMSVNGSTKTNINIQEHRNKFFRHTKNKKKALSTLNEIYNVLKIEAIDNEYNGVTVKSMLADDRSAFFYTKGIWGYKIVETKYVRYYKDTKCMGENKYVICLKYPYSKVANHIILTFDKPKLSKNVQNLLYNNQNKKIIVAAYFISSKDKNDALRISTRITSEKQIILI